MSLVQNCLKRQRQFSKVITALSLSLTLAMCRQEPVRYYSTVLVGAPVKVVDIDLNDPRVEVGLITANSFPNGDESFQSMVKRENPTIAIDGGYFDKSSKRPIGDIRANGQTLFTGMMGTCLAIDDENRCKCIRVPRGHRQNWDSYSTVLGCGPALLLNGKVDVQWEREGFRDPHVIGRAARMGVGYTKSGHMLLASIGSAVTFEEEADVFKQLGCYEAMNLDAGASQAMYVKGEFVQTPGRSLTNLLAIWVRPNPSLSRVSAKSATLPIAALQGDYDVKKEQSWSAVITGGSGLGSHEVPEAGAELQLRTARGEQLEVLLGPNEYVRGRHFDFRLGDSVKVIGTRTGSQILARRVTTDKRVLYLRDIHGRPVWGSVSALQRVQPGNR